MPRSTRQLIGAGTLSLALLATGAAYRHGAVLTSLGPLRAAGAILGLVIAIILAYQFPIHVRHKTKIQVSSIPFYLIVALLPPPLAVSAAGLGFLAAELSVKAKRGNPWCDIITHAARLALVALLGSLIAHLQLPAGYTMLRELPFVAAALLLFAGDLLTVPLVLAPLTGERPDRIVLVGLREGGMAEGAQYFIGLLGALAATQQVWALALLALPTVLVYLAFRKQMDQNTIQILAGMADTVDARNPFTAGHCDRVADLVAGILEQLGMHGPEAKLILAAARVHDIGKIGIPDHILKKDGILSAEERLLMESHAEHGAELLARYPDFVRGVEIVRHHHERWDGEGYPHRLSGAQIPFGARVIAVADSFDAMTSDRPYRRALSAEQAAIILRDGRGRQWDPSLIDAFLRSIADRLETERTVTLRLVPAMSSNSDLAITAETG
jgi:HD-GYP domain-containing protein (c-di-GMP phosphodiesterase class II)